jgi:hypothetical protein
MSAHGRGEQWNARDTMVNTGSGRIHSRVSFNSYSINALVNKNLKTVVKQKTLEGWYAPVLAFA